MKGLVAAASVVISMSLWMENARSGSAQKDLQLLQGKWQIESCELSGEEKPFPKSQTIVIQGDWFKESNSEEDEPHFVAVLKLDAGKSPKTFEFHVVKSNPDRIVGKTLPRIYKIDGDRFTYSSRGTEMAADAFTGPGIWTVVLKRVSAN